MVMLVCSKCKDELPLKEAEARDFKCRTCDGTYDVQPGQVVAAIQEAVGELKERPWSQLKRDFEAHNDTDSALYAALDALDKLEDAKHAVALLCAHLQDNGLGGTPIHQMYLMLAETIDQAQDPIHDSFIHTALKVKERAAERAAQAN